MYYEVAMEFCTRAIYHLSARNRLFKSRQSLNGIRVIIPQISFPFLFIIPQEKCLTIGKLCLIEFWNGLLAEGNPTA